MFNMKQLGYNPCTGSGDGGPPRWAWLPEIDGIDADRQRMSVDPLVKLWYPGSVTIIPFKWCIQYKGSVVMLITAQSHTA